MLFQVILMPFLLLFSHLLFIHFYASVSLFILFPTNFFPFFFLFFHSFPLSLSMPIPSLLQSFQFPPPITPPSLHPPHPPPLSVAGSPPVCPSAPSPPPLVSCLKGLALSYCSPCLDIMLIAISF